MLAWIKSFGLVQTLIAIATTLGMVLAARKVASLERNARDREHVAERLLEADAHKHFGAAYTHRKEAKKATVKAKVARKKMLENLEKLGKSDDTLDELAHYYNSARVRLRDDTTEPF